MTNINQIIFTRTQPKKKQEIVKALSTDELFMITTSTLTRIVKEVGYCYKKRSRNKDLRISSKFRCGNHWNSTVDALSFYRGKLLLELTVCDDSTDHCMVEEYDKFFKDKYSGYRVSYIDTDRYGNPCTTYAIYDREDKAAILRSFLLQYLDNKYASKLNQAKS